MKKILGLDLGTSSIGWAVVNEAQQEGEKSEIVGIGVRVNPLTVDEKANFEKGKSITTNADRRLKRGMRRNLQRYKLRREKLLEILEREGWISDETVLAEQGNRTTFETLRLRAKAVTEEISLEEFARVLLMINKKRGYKSNRKAKDSEADGQIIDNMDTAKILQQQGITPGEYAYSLLSEGKNSVPDFYRSDLEAEFNSVWEKQKEYYPEILTDALRSELEGKNEKQTWAICREPFNIVGEKRQTKGRELVKENYLWRAKALREKMDLEALAVVLQKINGQIRASSGYLGDISDRSKELYFNKITVGQYLFSISQTNPNASLKNRVFYRQDYFDEFNAIWDNQAKYHSELTDSLKKEIRDKTIFFQRPLRSQKGLINICEFEHKEITVLKDGKEVKKTVGPKVSPKSSPLFQEFKIWQIINNLKVNGQYLEQSDKEALAKELSIRDKMSDKEVLSFLYRNPKVLKLNYKQVEGNRTGAAFYKAFAKICELSGHSEADAILKGSAEEVMPMIQEIFSGLGFNTDILCFDTPKDCGAYEDLPIYKLWHLLYSYEGDNSKSGDDSLVEKIAEDYGFDKGYAKVLASISFQPDYGNLSTKAMKKILPYMKEGNEYSEACRLAGYRHSAKSLTKEELEAKVYKERIDILPKNSLRNPVVEKILNQMANVVNGVIGEYGRPDEIRIELARELKKNQEERKALSDAISKSSKENEEIIRILQGPEFNIANPSKNDIVRYKLYRELDKNGYHTLYTNTYIQKEKLFTKEYDIEHIIPQAKLFNDSFSNKTLETRQANLAKSDRTAIDYVRQTFGEEEVAKYEQRVKKLCEDGAISKTKMKNLLTKENDIPSEFLNRDLTDSQYIARKAKDMLEDVVGSVVTTTGAITARLREDWQLVDVMKELNWDKYNRLGLTYSYQDRDGRTIRKINEWTKRNDHRHHAMDAITIAFTRREFIQYLNNLNARVRKDSDGYADLTLLDSHDVAKEELTANIFQLESKYLYKDGNGRRRFYPPIPLDVFQAEAKRHLENTLVSIKAKNKVVTKNVNRSKAGAGAVNRKTQLTPRGQLHNETVYGARQRYVTKEEKVGSAFNAEKISQVASPRYREALIARLAEFGNDPKKAFTGKNSLEKNPIFLDEMHTMSVPEKVKTVALESIYTIRKDITPANFDSQKAIGKVIDAGVREILSARLEEYNGDATKAFSNLAENPIWLNKEKGIAIKHVTITGVSNAIPLHEKKDNTGDIILGQDMSAIPCDYVSTSNNHHIAIFEDADGNLQEHVVSLMEAVVAASEGNPVVDKEYNKDLGWKFLFTMKQNEYFVFPNPETGFNPEDIDLMDPANYALISPNLYRVQKLTTRDYYFRHHLETTVDDAKQLLGLTWKRIRTANYLKGIIKVRANHIGQIVQVGEY